MRAWEDFLGQQEKELGKETVAKWLRPLKILRYDACNLYLEAQDAFQLHWFEEHLRKKVLDQLLNNNRKRINVHLSIRNQPTPQKNLRIPSKAEPPPPTHHAFSLQFEELDPQCTLANYIVTDSNLLVYKVLNQVLGYDPLQHQLTPGHEIGSFNPIYLYGEQGTGKTHLLMACGHLLKQRGLNVLYCRADTFTNHVVSAIRSGEMIKFRQAYRHIDALIVDDVHVFSRKGATQEEFFHTFNTLHLPNKQIILSANCLPGELVDVEPRLISRFEWGIVLHLEPLKKEEKREVVMKKAEALDFKINPRVVDYLLEVFANNTKSLVRSLNALVLRTHLNEKAAIKAPPPNTVAVAKEYLKDLIADEERAALTPERILQQISAYFGITVEDILSKSQVRDCVLPRQLAMYFCRNELKLPFTKIGRYFSRDHSTVMSAIRQIQKGVDSQDKEISPALSAIHKKLREKESVPTNQPL